MTKDTIDISEVADRVQLEEMIADQYDDPEEREMVLHSLRVSGGVDMITGMPIDEDSKAPDKDEGDGEKPPPEGDKKADGEKPPPEGVKSPDGKTILDYSVLEAATGEARRLATENVTLKNVIAALKQDGDDKGGDKGGEGDGGDKAAPKALDTSKFDGYIKSLEAIEEDYGGNIANPFKELLGLVKGVHEEQTGLRAENEQLKSQVAGLQDQGPGDDEITKAIHANPELAKWHADHLALEAGDTTKDDSRWKQAVAFDAALSKDPAWNSKSLAEQYAEAERMVRVLHGDAAVTRDTKASEDDDPEKAAAAKKAAEAKAKETEANPPSTLSDLPPEGGDKNLEKTLEDMTYADAATLDLDKIDKILIARQA